MGILDTPENVEPTLEEKQAEIKNRSIRLAKQTFNDLIQIHNRAATTIWNNPMGLTPQEVVDGFGTDAVELFTLTYALKAFIETIKPGTITFQVPMNITLNEDGTVTLSEIEP